MCNYHFRDKVKCRVVRDGSSEPVPITLKGVFS